MQYLGPVYNDAWSDEEVVYPAGQGQNYSEVIVTAGDTGNYTFVAVGTTRLVVDYQEYYQSAVIGMSANSQVSVLLFHDGTTNVPQYVSVMVVPESGDSSRHEYGARITFSPGSLEGDVYNMPSGVDGVTSTAGGTVSLQIPYQTPNRYGYAFNGWLDSYGYAYSPGSYISVAASTSEGSYNTEELVAQWTTSGTGGGGGDNPGTGGGEGGGGGGSGKCYIYNGTNWVAATPYIYNGSTWVRATPYIYNGGWK